MDKERGPVRHSREVADKWHAAVATIGNHFLTMQGLEVLPQYKCQAVSPDAVTDTLTY